jgi:GNAT superfamily N-acetyltransferase
VLVRPRTADDLDACEEVVLAVQRVDGYPPHLPGDLRSFLFSPAIGAWVADVDGQVAGHVALLERSSPEVMELAGEVTGRPVDRMAVVARLAVAPEIRRRGAGRALLTTAADAAIERGLWPVLDVITRFAGAISLYESCGWRRAGNVTLRLGDRHFEELVFVGPSP